MNGRTSKLLRRVAKHPVNVHSLAVIKRSWHACQRPDRRAARLYLAQAVHYRGGDSA